MGEEEVTEFIKKILGKSEALPYCAHFKGVSDEKFKSYSFEDFKCVLPCTEEGEVTAAEIKAQIELALMMERFKAEKRAGGAVSSFFQTLAIKDAGRTTDESDGDGVDEIKVEIVTPKLKEVEVIDLESDDEEIDKPEDITRSDGIPISEGIPRSEGIPGSKDNPTCELRVSLSDEVNLYSEEPPSKRQRQETLALTTEPLRLDSTSVACGAEIQTALDLGSSETVCISSCTTNITEEGNTDQQWYDEIHGQHCKIINAHQWCWNPLSHRCQKNLFRILCNSSNVEELTLYNDATGAPADINVPARSLLRLKKLVAFRERNMNTTDPLRIILKTATNLENFEYQFSTEIHVDLLGDFDWSQLGRLVVISTSSPSYLNKAQIENLLRVRAPKLTNLWIGHGFYEDVSGDLLENVLKNFPNLEHLHIPGQYYSHTNVHPEIIIDFPKLTHLKYLCLGENYGYGETVTLYKNKEFSAMVTEKVSTRAKPFHVTLKFCGILSNLKTLILGKMYNVDSLHLKCFPKLEVLRIGSPWHLSVIFPDKNARSYNYPLINDLQLPDGLNDASFVRNIPERFPNVKICHLYLPSACVLRKFFNVMKDVQLKELHLKTQFDFSSTMDSCLLDNVLPINSTCDDLRRVTMWERLAKWNEFVDQNNIILPLRTDDEVQAFVEATGEYGLGALKHLDKFYLEHIPRLLIIPKRSATVESNERAQYTIKMGFQRYPVSSECCDVVRRSSKKYWWNLQEPEGEREKRMQAGYSTPSSSDASSDVDEMDRPENVSSSVIHYSNPKEEN